HGTNPVVKESEKCYQKQLLKEYYLKRIVLLATLIGLLIVTIVIPRTSSAASYTATANATPAAATRGTTITIDTNVTSSGATSLLIDLEVYRPDGQKAFQQAWDNQAFTAGQQRSFRATWAAPADAQLGTYALKVGVFAPGWSTLYYWNDAAGQLSVATSSAPSSGMGADTFSVRWQGQVQPRFSETYTFYTTSDDGVRLWINGQQLINK